MYRYGTFFILARRILMLFYGKYPIHLKESLREPVVYISHHHNFFGPIITLLSFPTCLRVWMLDILLVQQTSYKHFVDYTFTKRFGFPRFLAKLIAFPLSFFISRLLRSGKGIPVYRRSNKIAETFSESVDTLIGGNSIVIFPDIAYSDNSAKVKEIYNGFLYLDMYYYRATGKHIRFVPLYASKKKRLLISDLHISFTNNGDFEREKAAVSEKIRNSLNELAKKCGDI